MTEPATAPAETAAPAVPAQPFRAPRTPLLARLWLAVTLTAVGLLPFAYFLAVRTHMSAVAGILTCVIAFCAVVLYFALAVFDPVRCPRPGVAHAFAMKGLAILDVVVALWLARGAMDDYERASAGAGETAFLVLASLLIWAVAAGLYFSGDARLRRPPA
ncbi:MAG: hypothetical protein KIS92_12155 [Planctomycetota bacterium]|nr:hypothetical protein [Planctomycetota bacterium]